MSATWCGSFLLVNYTSYQNSRLVHKQQPADGAAPGRHVAAPQGENHQCYDENKHEPKI